MADAGVRKGLDRSEVERYIAGRPPVELAAARSIVRRAAVAGPAVLVQQDSTVLVPPAYAAEVSEYGSLHVRRA